MIPVTRKELYLNKIVGNDDYDIPEKPISEEELFFAEILGEAVQAPEPLTRYQIYLAKIAGRDIEIPYPEARLEYFLAKAAGMDITVPIPITREEIFWSNYTAIVEFEVEGVLPLTYKAIEGTLENYRIFGNTVDGESVGDRTGNLFDGEVEQGSFMPETGIKRPTSKRLRTTFTDTPLPAGTYTINAIGMIYGSVYAYTDTDTGTFDASNSITDWTALPFQFTLDSSRSIRFSFCISDSVDIVPSDISNIMLNSGSTALPYEPYGYKVPVTVSNGTDTLTTPIYLPEQIRKVGDEAEYIDYGQQKQHRVRKNLLQNTATSQTINGVTFTVNNDGSVTCNGTASVSIFFSLKQHLQLEEGQSYYLTGCPTGGGGSSFRLYAQTDLGVNFYLDSGNGAIINYISQLEVLIVIYSGYTCDNLTFYPMIRKADIEDDTYEPYIENVGLDVTLPALPTLTGTNVLTVGTEVQPSKVYIKGEKEREYT